MEKKNGTAVYLHTDTKLTSFLDSLPDVDLEASYYLLVLSGPNKAGKKEFMKKLEKKMGVFDKIDLGTLINQYEEDSYQKINEVFTYIGETEKNLLLTNGDVLAGEYTGFTYSTVRYATPQEKYLLEKIKGSERFFVIEIQEFENIDKTLERYSQAIVRFQRPDTFFGKLFWKLRNITIHGHTFANKRPSSPA